jgi:hypothetical protein
MTIRLLNLKKVTFASALIAGSVLSTYASAQSVNVTVGGVNYTVTTTTQQALSSALANSSYALTSQPWFGSVSIANQFAGQVQYQLGAWNSSTPPSASSTTPGVLFLVSTPDAFGKVSFWRGSTGSVVDNVGGPGTLSAFYAYIAGYTPIPSGPTAEEIAALQAAILRASTQQSVANTAQALQGTYALQNSVLANSFTYDCTLFDKNNICVSGGARNTAVQAVNGLNNTSALLIAAYRPIASVRIGAYADQNLSVNNGGSTVNLGNNTPLIGLFAAWNQRQDDTGTEVRGSIAYGQKDTTINRQVVGTSQAGTGSSTLISQGAQLTAKYGFGLSQAFVVSPYAGVRYSQNNMGGYTEGASAGVTAPLTFGAVNTNATTLLAGVGGSFRGIPKTNLFASAGIESDTNTAAGTVNGTSSTITGLTPVNFNANPVKTRPTATVGATYDVEKNQRLGVTGIYRQEAYQAVSTTTVMATYTVGF